MRRLLYAEFEKFIWNWLLSGILFLTAAFFIVVTGKNALLLQARTQQNDAFAVRTVLGNAQLALWYGAVLAAFFVGQEFENRTVNIPIMHGHSRMQVFFSKVLAFYITGLVFSQTVLFVTLFAYYPSWYLQMPAAQFIQYILLRIVCDLGTLSIPLFLAFLCRDLVRSVSFSAAYALVYTLLAEGSLPVDHALGAALSWHPLHQLSLLAKTDGAGVLAGVVSLRSIGLVLGTGAAAYLIFRRAPLK